MVKSGLGDDRRGDRKEIRVTPYRLAAHLTTAFVTYAGLVWTGLELLCPEGERRRAAELVRGKIEALSSPGARAQALQKLARFRSLALLSTALTAVTVTSGAFVAGNDAGNAYNDWPYMNGRLVPWEDMIDTSGTDGPAYLNVFENTAFVQFDHRILAYATSAAIASTAAYGAHARGALEKLGLRVLSPQVTNGLRAMCALAVCQVSLGISTLVLYVPVHLAASHQLGSLALLTSGVFLTSSMRYIGMAVRRDVGKGGRGVVGGAIKKSAQ
jgi:cytochrome c oxidase assembly protein subunit 15